MHFLSILLIYTGFFAIQTINGLSWNDTYPKGQVIRVGDLNVYSVGQNTKNFAVIVLYDIRGFNISQTRVFCDRLASEYSIRVVMPDVFRDTAAPSTGNFQPWLASVGNWSIISNDLTNIANWLRINQSINQIGLIGFCWGGLQVVRACSNLSSLFSTGVSIHGSSITVSEVSLLQKPMFFIAASNDPALHPNISGAIERATFNISKLCEYKTYLNVSHGFAAAGANYSNPDNVVAIDDVHVNVRNYFTKILNNIAPSFSMNLSLLVFVFLLLIFI
ncbi:hypothetical protein I4U23_024784 [Adineta vaga]|nr:hypothetical protein I4U23_024784 [Adineta vaga]